MRTFHEKRERAGKSGWRMMRKHSPSIALVVLGSVLVLLWWLVLPLFFHGRIFFAELRELPVREPPRTVVSISSFSQRVFNMKGCLDSIFAQSQLPDRVIITIPRKFRVPEKTTTREWSWFYNTYTHKHQNETEADLVDWFSKYVGAPYEYHVNPDVHKTSYVYTMGTLTVQFLDGDWGPATKLIGALLLEKDPETVIITLDDDMAYNSGTVKWLSTHMQPNIALSFGCEMWNVDRSGFIDFTMWSIHDFYMTTPRVCHGWLVGWTGVAYHVSSFGPDIWTFQQSLPTGCFNNDDMWLSGYVARQGVTKIYAPMVIYHGKIMYHGTHLINLDLSLSTIVNYREKGYSCGRHLFPEAQVIANSLEK